MAQAVDTDEKVARFRREVLPRLVEQFRPSNVLVFGSRARGDALRHSDLDVVIVSAVFGGMKWLDRAPRVYLDCDIHLDVELLCYTPEEYARKVEELGIVRVATLEGVDLLGGPPTRVAEPGRVEPARGRWQAQAECDLENARKNIAIGAYSGWPRRRDERTAPCSLLPSAPEGTTPLSPLPGFPGECRSNSSWQDD